MAGMTTDLALDDRAAAARAAANRGLVRRPLTMADELRSLADHGSAQSTTWDIYGAKGPVSELESRVAQLLDKPAAAFFPSGVMAQQAALRAWCDRSGCRRVALPDLSHLLHHEGDGPRVLHDFELHPLTIGAVTARGEHVVAIPGRVGAILVELPLRDGGYLLPSWSELVEVSSACRGRSIPLHFDGARLWESAPWFDRPLSEIAALADSIYVSFYKGLGGLAGACIAGPADVVEETRLWRKRMGGTVYTLFPHALAALRGLDTLLPRMPEFHTYAKELANALTSKGFRTSPVHSVAFRLFAPWMPRELRERAIVVMERDRIVMPDRWSAADVPGWSWTEITVGPTIVEWPVDEAASVLERLLAPLPG